VAFEQTQHAIVAQMPEPPGSRCVVYTDQLAGRATGQKEPAVPSLLLKLAADGH
jgi:hypothetical protein